MRGQSWRQNWGPPTPGCRSVGTGDVSPSLGAHGGGAAGAPWLGPSSPPCAPVHQGSALLCCFPPVLGTAFFSPQQGRGCCHPSPYTASSTDLREQRGDDGLLQPTPALPGEAVTPGATLGQRPLEDGSAVGSVPFLSPLCWGLSLVVAACWTAHLVAARNRGWSAVGLALGAVV